MEQIRSFIAIELPSEIKAELVSLEERLKAGRYLFVKWVDPESIHLTLKFLGNIAQTTVPEIIEAVARVAQPISPFHLQIGGLGAFPNWRRPQVVWVGVGGEVEKLAVLQRGIDSALSPLGFPPESRSFSPHLTLGRFRERVLPKERQSFAQWACSVKFEASLSFEVNALSLMKSQLTPSGAIYSQLAAMRLVGEPFHT
ncbi:MAG TPA: RNA 2',3'-cyclic phosphodiesterase [Dehalococcoidia bacterium]|nr:RNA 2',3'-cyclic phosphodiesterase [Dehalococcoidia bacterium]